MLHELARIADVEPPIAARSNVDARPATSRVDYSGPGGGSIDAMVAAFPHYADDVRPRKKNDPRARKPELVPMPKPYEHDKQPKPFTGPKLAGDYLVEEL